MAYTQINGARLRIQNLLMLLLIFLHPLHDPIRVELRILFRTLLRPHLLLHLELLRHVQPSLDRNPFVDGIEPLL